jgi:alanine racemase
MSEKAHRVWAEINLDNIVHNFNEIKRIINRGVQIMAVVKADAYGHGAVRVAKLLVDQGVDRLAVATLEEAIPIRKSGVTVPVHILSYTFPEYAEEILDYNLIQTIFDIELAEALSCEAKKRGEKAEIHVKINTGMNRVGFPASKEGLDKVCYLNSLDAIEIEGIMTHFSSADEESSEYTLRQFNAFKAFCDCLEKNGIHIPIKHVSNSSAIMRYPEMNLDMVRSGLALFGLYTSTELKKTGVRLKPAMTFKARVIDIMSIGEDQYLGYGRSYITKRKSVIATVSAGYIDGYPRLLSNNCKVLHKSGFAPVVGNICMDHFMIDITDIAKDVRIGDEIIMFGETGDMEISADDIAQKLGTVSNEVIGRLGGRVREVYIEDGIEKV